MKKLSIILLALAFALAFTVPAMAIHIGSEGTGEASLGISGTYQFDGQVDDTDAGKNEYFDDDLELVMKYVTGDITAVIDWEISDRNPLQGHTNDESLIDNYYIMWNATDALTFKAGEYALGFGRKVVLYNEGGSGLSLMYALDNLSFQFDHGKDIDGLNADGDDADSTDNMLRVSVKEAGPFTKLDLIYAMSQTEEGAGGAPADQDDSYLGLDFAVMAGPVALAGEFGSLGGDVADDAFFLVEIGLEELVGFDLGLTYFSSGVDFNPTPFNGEDDYTPLGVYMDDYNAPQADTTAIMVNLGYSVNDNLSLWAAALVSAENDAGDDQGTEFDVGLAYKLADNVLYKASYSSYSEGDVTAYIDRTELFHRIQFKF